MNSESNKNEWKWSRDAQLEVVLAATIFTSALIAQIFILDWETWVVPFLILELILFWAFHVTELLPQRYRIILYCTMILMDLFYFGVHDTSLYTVPILMVVALALFLSMDNLVAIYIGTLMYLFILLWHFFVLHTFTLHSSINDYMHLIIGFVAVIGTMISKRNGCWRRKQAIAKNRATVEKLADLNRHTEDFLTNVTHELRTPINAVTGITASLLRDETDAQKRSELIAIQQAGQRLFRQIRDILDYSEIGLGRLKITNEPYRVSLLTSDVLHIIQHFEHNLGIDIIYDIDVQLPSVCIGDMEKIKTVIRHLIDNAIKFTHNGAIYIRIYGIPTSYGINLCFTVCDTGIGMSTEQKSKIGTLFYQGMPERTREAGGIGLGFTVVSGLVQKMNGFFCIESELNKGTEVHVSIPQGVSDTVPFLSIDTGNKKNKLCIAYYFSRYTNPLAREFYTRLIDHMSASIHHSVIRVTSSVELHQIAGRYPLTHVFTTKADFEEQYDLFMTLSKTMCIIIVSDEAINRPLNANIIVILKPIDSSAVIAALRGKKSAQIETTPELHFTCPGVKVLVVDDDPMNLLVARNILKQYDVTLVEASSGKEAISICKNENFDIVFLDHMMPEMDGIECLHHLRVINAHSEKNMIAIALTANAVSGAREMFLYNGFDEFISKPIEIPVLERIIKKVLPASKIKYDTPKLQQTKQTVKPVLSSNSTLIKLRQALEALDYNQSLLVLKDAPSILPDVQKAITAVENFDFDLVLLEVQAAMGESVK